MRLHALRDRHSAPTARAAIARDTTTAPELLTFMAGDDAAAERRAAPADAVAGLPDTAPAALTRSVVAVRPQFGDAVAEAIAASADRPAIGMLLLNASAAIREATLDLLIETAAAEPVWQVALARRRALPPRTAERLAAADRAQATALEVARRGDRAVLAGMLAAASGIAPGRIEAAIAMRSPRVIAALCWRAGWHAAVAEAVQAAFGVEPARVVRCNAEGGWTLSPTELQWQVQMLEELPG
jgi:hypothetical protein